MNKINYQVQLDRMINEWSESKRVPTLLLHSCCAPCSSYVLEYLSAYMKITIFYYNPNIYPKEEYAKRVSEQKRLLEEMPFKYPVSFLEGSYDPARFFAVSKGLEAEPEGGARCLECYRLRLTQAAWECKKGGFDFFTTTLSISPLKNAEKLNEIGRELAQSLEINYLYSDFKKRGGYQRSIELSKEHLLYRQNFCGCIYSRRESESLQQT